MTSSDTDAREFKEIEAFAVELARGGGARVQSALATELTVRHKTAALGGTPARDPVSNVDRETEVWLREQISARYPTHGIVGEEFDDSSANSDFIWCIDPIDGTTNFVHAFPMFACSIGVLHRAKAVVGAVWCSTSHELRPGVYHARDGGGLRFEDHALRRRAPIEGVICRLTGEPGGAIDCDLPRDRRATGSAAIECALVAAGSMRWALFGRVHVWDVAGGVALAQASGLKCWTRDDEGWTEFSAFTVPAGRTLRDWREPLLLASVDDAQLLRGVKPV
jgi:myo-inositol-1(or 4)-monophosphatase